MAMPLGRGHHAGQQRADGMGNRVMDVQQIEVFRLGHLHHFYGQGQRIRSMIEQGIAGNFDFVELNSFVGVRQSDGRRVADKMDFMAARGQLHSKLRGDHAGAAVRWIASDSDLHLDAGGRPGRSSRACAWKCRRANDRQPRSLTNAVSTGTGNLLRPCRWGARFPDLRLSRSPPFCAAYWTREKTAG